MRIERHATSAHDRQTSKAHPLEPAGLAGWLRRAPVRAPSLRYAMLRLSAAQRTAARRGGAASADGGTARLRSEQEREGVFLVHEPADAPDDDLVAFIPAAFRAPAKVRGRTAKRLDPEARLAPWFHELGPNDSAQVSPKRSGEPTKSPASRSAHCSCKWDLGAHVLARQWECARARHVVLGEVEPVPYLRVAARMWTSPGADVDESRRRCGQGGPVQRKGGSRRAPVRAGHGPRA
jgi:hypothetical protein